MTERLDYAKAAPAALKALGGVHAAIAACGLPTALIDLVYLRISQINGCAYCIDKHSADLLKHGLALEKLLLVSVWREALPLFDGREQAALAWAESLTLVAETGVPDADFIMASAVFTEPELANLTIAVGLMNAYNRLAISLRKTPDSVAKAG